MSKTAISALQELMAAAQKPLPIYQEEGCINGTFQCSVHVNGISASGRGHTKKAAKQASAEQALKDLGSKTVTTLHLQCNNNNNIHSPSARNYVGELNEYASMSGVSYPVYNLDHVTMQTQFVIKCSFLGHETHGVGGNKKSAKQDSAKNMLEKIRTSDAPILDKYLIAIPKKISIEMNDTEIKSIEKILNDLSFKPRQARTKTSENVLTPEPELSFDSDSLEDMENALKSCDIKIDVNWMQSNPYIACVCIKDTSFTVLGAGETKNQALKKAFKDLLLMKKSGCSLNDTLFEFS